MELSNPIGALPRGRCAPAAALSGAHAQRRAGGCGFAHSFESHTAKCSRPWELRWDDVELAKEEPTGSAEVLGMGRTEPVYRGHLVQTGDPVAIKTLAAVHNLPRKHQQTVCERVRAQLDVCHDLKHENIVRYMGACTDLEQGIFIACEPVDGPNLREALDSKWDALHFDKCGKFIATCIARALQYLHTLEQPVIHRDIKSSNILVTSSCSTAKLADVGYAYRDSSGRTKGSTSVQWAAPELWLSQQATPLSDVYSFGVVLWELLTGENARWLQEKVLRNQGLALPPDTNPLAADLCSRCLHMRPKDRPSASEIVHELERMPSGAAVHAQRKAATAASAHQQQEEYGGPTLAMA